MYILYSSEGCHLCEEALTLCLNYIQLNELKIIDIVEDDNLVEQYGVHIPVLEKIAQKNREATQLFWPFRLDQVEAFVSSKQ